MSSPATPIVSRRDAWTIYRITIGESVNGELHELPPELRPGAEFLATLAPADRLIAFEAMAATLGKLGEALARATVGFGRDDPRPEADGPGDVIRPATIADLRVRGAEDKAIWDGFIPTGSIFGVAGTEGTGKTRFLIDLAARIYHGRPWPDDRPATLPVNTRTLWICSDGQQDEIAQTARAFGLPDEALAFCTTPDDPYGGTSIDERATLDLMDKFLGAERFAFVVVDSLSFATGRNTCMADETKIAITPLRDLAKRHDTSIAIVTHLALDGKPLGKRIQGLTRVLIQLEAPDPDGQPNRLKLTVPKSYLKKPSPIGVTMGEHGNEYDHDPPGPEGQGAVGRPPESRDKAVQFIMDALATKGDQQATQLCHEFEESGGKSGAFWRARASLVRTKTITCKGKPLVLRLTAMGADTADPWIVTASNDPSAM